MMSTAGRRTPLQKRYELIADALRANIGNGRLPAGFVLLEGPIAEVMQTSRAPVQAALRILEDDGLVHRFAGRGYLVGGAGVAAPPVRGDIRKLELAISDEIDEALQSRGTWELVYDRVEAAVADCLIFGAFRIVEAELGDNLGVSRTVVRDVLVRLHERGLVRKNQSSHWIAGPLTAETVRQRFAIRGLIEPAALRQAEAAIRYDKVARICERLDHEVAGSEVGHLQDYITSWEELEQELMEHCVYRVPNDQLREIIRHNQMPLTAANRALSKLGLPPDRFATSEYLTLFRLIERRLIDTAADYLSNHLRLLAEKSLARLKIVAVVSEPGTLAPYLTPYER